MNHFPKRLEGTRIHMVGIKGTGMAALAEILNARGSILTGSDGPERYYTDRILRELGIPYAEAFSADNLPAGTELVVHSAAYAPEENPELIEARRRNIPMLVYPEALGHLSQLSRSAAIAGTHGKTTTTAMTGAIAASLKLPVTVLAGSEVMDFGGRSTLMRGERYFIAETCEYRRHFLHFHPEWLVITNVEAEHLDYFRDLADVQEAFLELGRSLPAFGCLIYNADDPGCLEVVERLRRERPELRLLSFGRSASGAFRISGVRGAEGRVSFSLEGFKGEMVLRIPGEHNAGNAAAAVALCSELWEAEKRTFTKAGGLPEQGVERAKCSECADCATHIRQAVEGFRGSRRRSEKVGEAGGILFYDDYAHHPTEIARTLEGMKSFHPSRRLVVDFMPHTYSRTRALLEGFSGCFTEADELLLHDIYPSARERPEAGFSGETLYRRVSARRGRVRYFPRIEDAVAYLEGSLQPGDLFLTMGAGDNWRLGRLLWERLSGGRSS